MLAAALLVLAALVDGFACSTARVSSSPLTRAAVSVVSGGGVRELARGVAGHDVSQLHVSALVAAPQPTSLLSVGRRGGGQSSWYRRVSRHASRSAPVSGSGPLLAECIDMPRLCYSYRSALAEQPPERPNALAYWPALTTRPPPQRG